MVSLLTDYSPKIPMLNFWLQVLRLNYTVHHVVTAMIDIIEGYSSCQISPPDIAITPDGLLFIYLFWALLYCFWANVICFEIITMIWMTENIHK